MVNAVSFSTPPAADGLKIAPDATTPPPGREAPQTARLVLADGTVLRGRGIGALGEAVGEVCFNTAMTGYQEILTDPSYDSQIIAFTFPHIGNVGANDDDMETLNSAAASAAKGIILRADITDPSNYRATRHLDDWLKARGIVGIAGVDTRALTNLVRSKGMPNAVICHAENAQFDEAGLGARAAAWPGVEGADLVPNVTVAQSHPWQESSWDFEANGFSTLEAPRFNVIALDYGVKRNILRLLAERGCAVTVVPAETPADDILAKAPDGIFLANGPGDPAATGRYAVETLQKLVGSGLPIFGICLGHQMLALALGAKTKKMHQGHHGANHPVREHATGKVEIVSMNHGFAVDAESLPDGVEETHVSLFDGSNCGLKVTDKPIFSVQHHPEASPGPLDSHYLFDRFVAAMDARKAG